MIFRSAKKLDFREHISIKGSGSHKKFVGQITAKRVKESTFNLKKIKNSKAMQTIQEHIHKRNTVMYFPS